VWLVVGLGNPGLEYGESRHNVGFRVLEAVAAAAGVRCRRRRFESLYATAVLAGVPVTLVLPQAYMNLSGEPVRAWVESLRLPLERLLVIHDDIDLPLGRLRVIREGGHAGHKGVRAIQEALGTEAFPRLRLGVGRPPGKAETPEYVLGAFAPEEAAIAAGMIARAADGVLLLLAEGVTAAMNRLNVKPQGESPEGAPGGEKTGR
jgi:PTH1 family peptidyl-tRNA hydrolase